MSRDISINYYKTWPKHYLLTLPSKKFYISKFNPLITLFETLFLIYLNDFCYSSIKVKLTFLIYFLFKNFFIKNVVNFKLTFFYIEPNKRQK